MPVSSPSAVSADKLPPEPPEEKAYWHAINICKVRGREKKWQVNVSTVEDDHLFALMAKKLSGPRGMRVQ